MLNGFLRKATASQTRTIGPFMDDTDFITTENGLTIANTDIKIKINGFTAGNKNSGGATADVNGMYAITFNATDTSTAGELNYSVDVAGALIVTGKFIVLDERVYDAQYATGAIGFGKIGIESINNLGDFAEGVEIHYTFRTTDIIGANVTASLGSMTTYKNDETGTETTSGVTVSNAFDSITGIVHVKIDTSIGVFYETGKTYSVLIKGGTIDGVSVDMPVATFTIGKATASIDAILGTALTETTATRLATSLSTFLDNGDAVSSATLANITSILAKVPHSIVKNQAIANYGFILFDTSGDPLDSAVVTAQVSKDGAAYGAMTNAVTFLSDGTYLINIAAADVNCDAGMFKFTSPSAKPTYISFVTEP